MAQRKYCKNTVPGRQGRGKKYPARVRAEVVMAKKMLVQQIREQQEGRSVHGTV